MSENELSNGFDTDGISKLNRETDDADEENIDISTKYSLQGTTQGRYLTGGVPPVRFSM